MADEEQLEILRQGVDAWNAWREQNPDVRADFSEANLSRRELSGVNLHDAKLTFADLSWARLAGATLDGANLLQANLTGANLSGASLFDVALIDANLSEANLTGADLTASSLVSANLSKAKLTGADLSMANLNSTNFTDADLTGCRVHGTSAWNLKLEGAEQKNLIITPDDEPEITVDNLEVAQFIYVLLNNARIRHVIDTITSKVVLILGRFTDERRAVLEALRDELRQRDYLPVLFDFEKPRSRSTDETVSTLAHMARFVVADLTDAKSVLQELRAIVPNNPSVPVQPLILATQEEPGMFDFFRLCAWVLEPYRYADPMGLLAALRDGVIIPAEAKVRELRGVSPPT